MYRQTARFANTEPDPLPLPSFFDTRHIRQVFQMCQDHLWLPEFRKKQAKKTRCFQWFLIIYNHLHRCTVCIYYIHSMLYFMKTPFHQNSFSEFVTKCPKYSATFEEERRQCVVPAMEFLETCNRPILGSSRFGSMVSQKDEAKA